MKSRSWFTCSLVAASATFASTGLTPVYADEVIGVPQWVKGDQKIAKRPIPDTNPVQYEDDKDVNIIGGATVEFNAANMEVKCSAVRADNEPPKAAAGRAKMVQFFKWQASYNAPPTQYFEIDLTKGGASKAGDLIDESKPIDQRPGSAAGKSDLNEASNRSETTLVFDSEVTDRDLVQDTGTTGSVLFGLALEQNSAAAANTAVIIPANPPPSVDDDVPPPPRGNPTYPSKANFAEGRTYGKSTAPKPHGRSTW